MVSYDDLKTIEGWLSWHDFAIIRTLIEEQNEHGGAIVEIGVHHGKSFIAMAASALDRKLYAIDVFTDQSANIDYSGRGDRDHFLENIERVGIARSRFTIDERLSGVVSAEDIRGAVGTISFFHIGLLPVPWTGT